MVKCLHDDAVLGGIKHADYRMSARNETLGNILKRKSTRRSNRGSNWYKKSSYGACPNDPSMPMIN